MSKEDVLHKLLGFVIEENCTESEDVVMSAAKNAAKAFHAGLEEFAKCEAALSPALLQSVHGHTLAVGTSELEDGAIEIWSPLVEGRFVVPKSLIPMLTALLASRDPASSKSAEAGPSVAPVIPMPNPGR